jgi:hypothetical protein
MNAIVLNLDAQSPVDELGALNAQIAVLAKRAKALTEQIKAWGPGQHPGTLYSATVYDVPSRESYDAVSMETRLRELGVDDRWFSRHIKTTKASVGLRVTDL